MRLTLSLVLIAAVALYGASFLQTAKSAPLKSGSPPEAGARSISDAGPRSICIGCGGPIVPFDPSGGVRARQALDAARKPRPAGWPPPANGATAKPPGRAP